MTATKRTRSRAERIFFWTVGVVTAIPAAIILALFIPSLDEKLDFVTGIARRTVMTSREGGRTVADIVNTTYRSPRWIAFHRDYLAETYVRCEATDATGAPVALQWIVISGWNWRSPLHPTIVCATAQTRAAYNLAPSLYVKGQPLYKTVDYANW